MSNNPSSGENQQERLNVDWLVGFTDGEGTFSVSFVKNVTLRFGYQIFTEFVITQGAKSLNVLEVIQDFLGCGHIYVNNRHDNHTENIYRFCVRSRRDISEKIIPFFKKHPLLTAKKSDFETFCEIVEILKKANFEMKDFMRVEALASTMNRRKKRLESPTTDTPESSKDDKIQSELYGDVEVISEYTEITIKTN